jgi:guanylate kinase
LEQSLIESDPYNIQSPALLVVLSGPSGVGKDSVLNRMKELGLPFHFVVTMNTRPKRPSEIEGVDYHFVSVDQFEAMIERNELLEHAIVYNDHKGIPRQQVKEAMTLGKDVILRIDVQGAATIRRIVPQALLIFLTASSEAELEQRLIERQTESPEHLQTRLTAAREEMKCMQEFDYVVVNRESELDKTVADVMSIIRAEHCRVQPRVVSL